MQYKFVSVSITKVLRLSVSNLCYFLWYFRGFDQKVKTYKNNCKICFRFKIYDLSQDSALNNPNNYRDSSDGSRSSRVTLTRSYSLSIRTCFGGGKGRGRGRGRGRGGGEEAEGPIQRHFGTCVRVLDL